MSQRYTLTHRHLFLFGCAYYLFIPLVLATVGAFDSVDSLILTARYFDAGSRWWSAYVAFALLAPLMYLMGSGWTRLRQSEGSRPVEATPRVGARMLIPVYGLLLLVFTFQARALLFTGYSETVDSSLQGQLATLEMLLLYQYLYERGKQRTTATAFGLLLAINSLVLLSLGGRLYVMSALVAIYFRWWNWGALAASAQILSLLLVICVPVALVGIGMWRVGEDDLGLIGFYVTAESLFTAISGFTLFTGGHWSLLDMPTEFLAGFLNIVPAAVWPGKAEWLTSLTASMQNFDSPMGAVSIIASSVGNFGFMGALVFFGCVGAYMSFVARTRGNAAREAHYCYLVGLLPFMFFRDPFQIQIKLVVTGLLLYWITRILRPNVAAEVALAPAAIQPISE
ncbi:MAG: hypothetical protein H7346_24935 [Burkholderiaceae bacterium]|nr:hypothetical protein [Burkholderiaceae bacterium]